MTSITWAGPRYVQELGTFLGPENRTQRRCDLYLFASVQVYLVVGGMDGAAAAWIDSTEVFSGGRWRTVGALPDASNGLAGLAGVTIKNTVFMTGLHQTIVLHVLQICDVVLHTCFRWTGSGWYWSHQGQHLEFWCCTWSLDHDEPDIRITKTISCYHSYQQMPRWTKYWFFVI